MQSTVAVLTESNFRRMQDDLCQGERGTGEMVERLSLSLPAVFRHLRVLREAELVVSQVDKQHRRYRLRPGQLAELDAWLAPDRRFWAGRLDALPDHLDQEQE